MLHKIHLGRQEQSQSHQTLKPSSGLLQFLLQYGLFHVYSRINVKQSSNHSVACAFSDMADCCCRVIVVTLVLLALLVLQVLLVLPAQLVPLANREIEESL